MPTAGPNKRPLLAFAAKAAVALTLAFAPGASQSAKDTPFGVEMIAAHWPTTTYEDILHALDLTASIGGHSSRIWYWGDDFAKQNMPYLMALQRARGLKSLVQISSIFVGDPSPPQGFVKSFGNAETRNRYLKDVEDLAAMKPDYLVLMTEANIMYRFNKPEFDNYRWLYREAYYRAKAVSPNTKVGVSQLHTLWYVNFFIDHIDVPALLSPADFVAFTSYPEDVVREGVFASIAAMPASWYGSTRQAYPTMPILFTEMGWASKVRGTPEVQAEFVRNLPRLMSLAKPEAITWAVLHDTEFYNRSLLTPETTLFLESLGVDIDALFGHFNGMGLLDGYSNPKPAFQDASGLVFPKP
jgi:hypothetical protein